MRPFGASLGVSAAGMPDLIPDLVPGPVPGRAAVMRNS